MQQKMVSQPTDSFLIFAPVLRILPLLRRGSGPSLTTYVCSNSSRPPPQRAKSRFARQLRLIGAYIVKLGRARTQSRPTFYTYYNIPEVYKPIFTGRTWPGSCL